MNLANILNKYIDLGTNKLQVNPLEFLGEILDKISPNDYMSCIKLLLDTPIDFSDISGNELLLLLFSGLENNNTISLLSVYKDMVGK